jgi:hypothetical protein
MMMKVLTYRAYVNTDLSVAKAGGRNSAPGQRRSKPFGTTAGAVAFYRHKQQCNGRNDHRVPIDCYDPLPWWD